jgi:dCMP deaminase
MNALLNAARAGVSVLNGTVYLYFVKRSKDGDKFVNAFPCFMCKKMLINAGIKRFVGNDDEGKIVSFNVDDWVVDWKDKDLIEDTNVYNSNYSKEEAEKFKQNK